MNIWDSPALGESPLLDMRKRRAFQAMPQVLQPVQGLDVQPQAVQPMMPLPPVPAMPEQGQNPLAQLSGMGASRLMSLLSKKKPMDSMAAWKAGGSL